MSPIIPYAKQILKGLVSIGSATTGYEIVRDCATVGSCLPLGAKILAKVVINGAAYFIISKLFNKINASTITLKDAIDKELDAAGIQEDVQKVELAK